MKRERSDQLLVFRHGILSWVAPWSGWLLGFLAARPIGVRDVVIGVECVASDNMELCRDFPSLAPLNWPIEHWVAPRELPVRVGQLIVLRGTHALKTDCEVVLHLERLVPDAPSAETPSTSKDPVEFISRTQNEAYTRGPVNADERQALRAAKRARQVSECLAVLQQPYERKRYR